MAGKTLKQRIGVDLGRRLPLEDGIRWAAENGVEIIDAQTDIAPNAKHSTMPAAPPCASLERAHQLWPAYIVGGMSPKSRPSGDAVDAYMKAYIDLAPKRRAMDRCPWRLSFHQQEDRDAGGDRQLKRIADYAAEHGVLSPRKPELGACSCRGELHAGDTG